MRFLVRELIETVILALLIFLALQFSVQNFRVEGSSMQPTLEGGQYLLVNKLVYFRFNPQDLGNLVPFLDIEREESVFPFHPPQAGEVIIFHFPRDETRDFVKRVIGVPGDTVEIRRNRVFVNGLQVDEPYITHQARRSSAPVTVAEESYFVLGDNRQTSNDSRDWGLVPAQNVVGRAWVSYWPLERFHLLHAFTWR